MFELKFVVSYDYLIKRAVKMNNAITLSQLSVYFDNGGRRLSPHLLHI
jgi:hypothetical protein